MSSLMSTSEWRDNYTSMKFSEMSLKSKRRGVQRTGGGGGGGIGQQASLFAASQFASSNLLNVAFN